MIDFVLAIIGVLAIGSFIFAIWERKHRKSSKDVK